MKKEYFVECNCIRYILTTFIWYLQIEELVLCCRLHKEMVSCWTALSPLASFLTHSVFHSELQQILSSIDLFLYYRTDYTDYRTIYDFTLLNGCTGKCVRLSRLLAFECTLNHCTFIHLTNHIQQYQVTGMTLVIN